jgi:pimeloyl-ACP methyl ester carboxylesterase
MDIVLVHGSYHGAWCWDRLRPELERLGHRTVAVDLPISDPMAAAAEYAQAVADAIDPGTMPVVVGHSMAGLVIPLVPALRPVERLVFLAAFIAAPAKSANEQRGAEPIDGRVPLKAVEFEDLGNDVWKVGPNTATELFFHDADATTAAWAIARLRPQCYRVMNEPSPLTAWPSVASDSIVCRDDRALNPDWVRDAARRRLGVEAVEIDGGHSPFMTRPAELAGVIDALIGPR